VNFVFLSPLSLLSSPGRPQARCRRSCSLHGRRVALQRQPRGRSLYPSHLRANATRDVAARGGGAVCGGASHPRHAAPPQSRRRRCRAPAARRTNWGS
jgi:hypothetical protein